MMRRLIQKPARQPCRRRFSPKQKTPGPRTSTSIGGSCRLSSGDSAARSQLDDGTSARFIPSPHVLPPSRGFEVEGVSARQLSSKSIQASHRGNSDFFGSGSSHTGQDVMVTPPIPPTSSPGFEIQGVSTRQLSSEAIQPLSSPRGNNAFFGSSADSNDISQGIMRNTLLNSIQDGSTKNSRLPADAYLDLFKAISTLNQKPSHTSTEPSIPESENNVLGMESPDLEDEKLGMNDTPNIVANEELQETQPEKYVKEMNQKKHKIALELGKALQQNPYHMVGYEGVIKIFEEARRSPHKLLGSKQITNTFSYIVKSDLIAGYDVLKYYATRCKEQGRIAPLYLYHELFTSLREAELPLRAPRRNTKSKTRLMTVEQVQNLVKDISQHIQEEYSEGKKMVYQYILLPEMVVTLSCHRNPYINKCAKPIMEHILDSNFPPVNLELYEQILENAAPRNIGPDFLPHHRVLSQLVSNGYRPKPETVVSLLHCYHPFTDTQATHEVLSIIKKLHPENDPLPSAAEDYRVGLGVLESISMASARRNIELNLLVWDVTELFGYNATESMFEDVILSFAATIQDENMYTAMVDMEKNGFVPSHALLRIVAVKIAYSQKRLDYSQKMLAWHQNEHIRSTHTMNAVMKGYGMNRDLNSAFLVYEDLARFNLKPDANTFWFLMEILYIDTKDRFPYQAENPPQLNPEDIEDVLGAAQIILDAMEEAGIEKTRQFYHEHIRVLCALGLLDDAKLVFEEALHSGTPLLVQSLFILATRFTDRGDFEKAFAIAGLSEAAGCGPLPHLHNRIVNIKNGKRRTTE